MATKPRPKPDPQSVVFEQLKVRPRQFQFMVDKPTELNLTKKKSEALRRKMVETGLIEEEQDGVLKWIDAEVRLDDGTD